jgi:D-sedoheptulose 7-phosphate isomerase
MKYLTEITETIDKLPLENIKKVIEIIKATKGTIYVFGNGGSAATASHFACDMNKMTDKRVVCLNDSIPTMLAIANDSSFQEIFVEQLVDNVEPYDVVIGISGSGYSEDVVYGVSYANEVFAETIGLTGFDGGVLAKTAKYSIIVPIHDMQIVEDIHLMICHMIVRSLL